MVPLSSQDLIIYHNPAYCVEPPIISLLNRSAEMFLITGQIYSLGVVIYEMLTGDLPFIGDTSIDISFKHVNEKPVRLSDLISGIPKKLDKLMLLCLEKKSSGRYPTIEDLKKDLVNFLEKRPLLL